MLTPRGRSETDAERAVLARPRQGLQGAIRCFSSMLQYAEWFVENAPAPCNFGDGRYLGSPFP